MLIDGLIPSTFEEAPCDMVPIHVIVNLSQNWTYMWGVSCKKSQDLREKGPKQIPISFMSIVMPRLHRMEARAQIIDDMIYICNLR
jgi:hypothetical protein